MPITLTDPNNTSTGALPSDVDIDFEYTYPNGLDFDPESEFHAEVLQKLLKYAQDASDSISQRYSEWSKIDQTLTAFVPPETKQEAQDQGDQTNPVIIPSSYAILETLLAYMVATFLQDPVFKYEPTGPEDAKGAALLEIIIQTQVLKAKMGLNLHTQWRDGLAYGIGVATPFWDVIRGHRRVKKEVINPEDDIAEVTIVREEAVLYEGNFISNIDPFLYLPDPSVAAQDIQKGKYVGWISKDNKLALLDEELENEDEKEIGLFNVKFLRFITGQSKYNTDQRLRGDSATNEQSAKTYTTGMDSNVDLLTMYVTLIPDDWGLGDSEKPEKWAFLVAGDKIIIGAQPLNLDHNMYPVSVAVPDFDGYSATPISRIEISLGMQEIVDFLINSRIANVRKAVNDTLIVDPSRINMNDLRDPKPGGIIRTRRSSWGQGVTGAIEQLKIVDITKSNWDDIALLTGQMKEATSAVDSIAGNVRSGGERRSATEFRDARTGALAKLNKTARMIAMQSMQDYGFIFASQTQQLMSDDMKVKLTGRWSEDLTKEYGADTATVSVEDILVDTDVVVGAGNIPGGEPTELWIQLLQSISGSPETLAQMDVPRIFLHIARQLGATNAVDFMKNVEVQPDAQVTQQVEEGNLVPVGGV